MASRKFSASAADVGRTLAEGVAARLGITCAAAARAIESGAVYIDRRRVTDPDAPLRAGNKITVRDVPGAVAGQAGHDPRHWWGRPPNPPTILVVTGDAIAIDKPAGLAAQATRDSVDTADRWVISRYPDARLVHRLDRDTAGVLLFSRGRAAHAQFRRWLDAGQIERLYTAVVWGVPDPASGVIDRPIGPDPSDRRRQTISSGKPARTEYQTSAVGVSAGGKNIARLSLRLRTGRTHQARVHLAAIGHPICGDPLYCRDVDVEPVGAMALWARRLEWPNGSAESVTPLNIPTLEDVLT